MPFLVQVINWVFNIFYLLIIGRIIFSWLRVSPYHRTWGPIMRFVYDVTEPVMAPVRRLMPPMSGLDLSPMIVLLLAGFIRQLLIQILVSV